MATEAQLPPDVTDPPAGAVGPGVHYTRLPPPDPEGYVEVFVSHVTSPGLFWLQLRGKDTTLALENLMDMLETFYNSDSSRDYMIPDSLLAPGQVCAAIFPEDHNWHRAVIIDTMMKDDNFVQVFYVDYGNTCLVNKNSIRLLKSEYMKLPAQALQARLDCIAPKDKVWKPAARTRMMELCFNKPLIAFVTSVDKILSVSLTDTNTSEEIHVNDVLVCEGHAVFCPDTQVSQQSTLSEVPQVPSQQQTGEIMQPKKKSQPFTVRLELDFMQLGLFILALITRTWQLGLPRAVVFDELHFAKFVSLYLKKIFFFDAHPPLGKMMLAAAGSYAGFEGDIGFDRIGAEYSSEVPVQQLRLVPALCGSLVVPLVYQIAVELGFTRWAALLAGAFILLDNALIVQSRFMLMEGMLLCFLCLSLLCLLKFRNLSHREFSLQWWMWLCMTGVSFTLTLSVKYIGCFTALLILYAFAKDYWKMIGDFSRSDLSLVKHILARCFLLLVVPVVLYIYIFYVHLSILTKAGPHDNVMTSAFQASLEGGLATLTKGQPLDVSYGSQITLRHTFDPVPGRPCWLHSHAHVYPIRYPDGRGSSHQQQVTCYVFKDVNNWWIIKHPDKPSMTVDDPPVPVRHGDIIQLVHGITSRALNSHDVAAPVSPHLQEVSCYINYNVSMAPQNLWRVEILNRESDSASWETIKSHIRLVHVNTSQALKTSGKQLPEWGFNQHEVATDRILQQDATIWNVEEHRYTHNLDAEGHLQDLTSAEMIPLEPTHLSFWAKFWEVQMKMFFSQHDAELEHKYSSSPLDWAMMSKNIAYWMSSENNAQIHLIGNVMVWSLGTIAVVFYIAIGVLYLLRRRRRHYDLSEDEWGQFVFTGELLVIGYFLHYIPHFLTDSTLFLYHYLPSVVYKVLVTAAVVNHIGLYLERKRFSQLMLPNLVISLIAMATWVFVQLLPVTYGNVDLNQEQVDQLTWKESWEFLLHDQYG